MRICHISDCHTLDDNRIFLKECSSLSDVGYDVSIIAVGTSGRRNNVNRIGLRKRGIIGRIFVTRHEIRLILKEMETEVVHLHDPTLLLLVKYFKKKGKKVIFDSHEDYFQQIQYKSYLPKILRLTIARVYNYYLWNISKYLDGFVFPAFENQINVKIPITIVGNSPVIPKIGVMNVIKPICERERCICYVGGLTESRGIVQLIKVAYLAKCKLVLAGPFSSNEFFEKCRAMKEYSCVDYRGVLKHEKVLEIFNESRIGMAVLLNIGQYSNANNLATKVTEYCLSGLPVFLNDTPYNRKMVNLYNFGICIIPDDINAYADKLIQYLDNYKLLETLGRNGRELVVKKFNWGVEFCNLHTLYKNIEGNRCDMH